MAKIDLDDITAPISEDQPCGPDLDMEFDMDFMNFTAEIDGVIPTKFFGWDPGSLDFNGYYDKIGDFLQRTRDIRLLVPLAKLKILQSDLAGFADVLQAIHRLLKEWWSDVHPQPADFLELSMGQLSTLDDMPNVVLPLQHAPIVRSRRAGVVTLRRWQLAHGEVNAREGEETVDAASLSAALAEAAPEELDRIRSTVGRARDAVAGIRTVCMSEAGYDRAPQLERLPAALEAVLAMISPDSGEAVQAGDAGGAPAQAASGDGAVLVRLPAGAVQNREDAVEAMHAAARYFALKEPSSPVPILLREAQTASSKSFAELLSDLVPDYAGSAFLALGREPWFEVHISALDARNPAPDYAEEQEAIAAEDTGLGDESDEADEAGVDDEAPADDAGEDESEFEAAERADGDGESGDAADDDAPAGNLPRRRAAGAADVLPQAGPSGPKFVANSRPEAVALMEKVLAYYRVAEPTSPVPLLIERAIEMSSKSFIELLGKVLPEGSLKVRVED